MLVAYPLLLFLASLRLQQLHLLCPLLPWVLHPILHSAIGLTRRHSRFDELAPLRRERSFESAGTPKTSALIANPESRHLPRRRRAVATAIALVLVVAALRLLRPGVARSHSLQSSACLLRPEPHRRREGVPTSRRYPGQTREGVWRKGG